MRIKRSAFSAILQSCEENKPHVRECTETGFLWKLDVDTATLESTSTLSIFFLIKNCIFCKRPWSFIQNKPHVRATSVGVVNGVSVTTEMTRHVVQAPNRGWIHAWWNSAISAVKTWQSFLIFLQIYIVQLTCSNFVNSWDRKQKLPPFFSSFQLLSNDIDGKSVSTKEQGTQGKIVLS